MDIEAIKKDVVRVLDYHNKANTYKGVNTLVDTWLQNKLPLIELLRKHPNWNENILAVLFDYDTIRSIDISQYWANVNSILGMANSPNINSSVLSKTMEICAGHQFMTKEVVAQLANIGVTANVGQKVSRFINSTFQSYRIPEIIGQEEYNTRYGRIADAINPLKLNRHTLLSVHPCDFLHMSYGYRWQSCHNIDDGCYMAGTISYMQDGSSMIFYTVDKDYNGEKFFNERKLNRQVYAFNDNVLLQSRLYPDCNDSENITNFRNAVQSIISTCLGKPNLWSLSRSMETIERTCHTHYDAKHYKDYTYESYSPSVSTLKGESHGSILIGSCGTCIECGRDLDDNEHLTCSDCNCEYSCCECGEMFNSDDDLHLIDGNYYCEDCCFYCDDCEEWVVGEGNTAYEHNGWSRCVCSSCLEDNYTWCDECDRYVENESVGEVGSNNICESCLSTDKFGQCLECEEYFYVEDLNDAGLCHNCANANEEEDAA